MLSVWDVRGGEVYDVKNLTDIKEIVWDVPKFRYECKAESVLEAIEMFTVEVNRRRNL
jgi:hypothetical protein